MRESDLLAFQVANEVGHPGSVMCAYNRVNSVYACENGFLLNDVLRRDWHFGGFVMSDWGAVHSVGAFSAGLDQESAYKLDHKPYFGKELKEALDNRSVSVAAIDKATMRILTTLFAAGVYDMPLRAGETIDYNTHALVAQAEIEAGMVLLRNEDGILPLKSTPQHIAVIGGHADIGVLSGGGSSEVVPVGGTKLALKQKGGGMMAVVKRNYGGRAPLDALTEQFPQAKIDFNDGTDHAAAAAQVSGP